jgi:hypothetical protein
MLKAAAGEFTRQTDEEKDAAEPGPDETRPRADWLGYGRVRLAGVTTGWPGPIELTAVAVPVA